MKDYYAILGVDSDASLESIKHAYRRLAREAHPDHAVDGVAEATERMTDLNEAYKVLVNRQSRKEYDRERHASQAQGKTGAAQAAAAAAPASAPPAAPVRVQSTGGLTSEVVRVFSNDLRKTLLSSCREFPWREAAIEGFEWAIKAEFFLSRYYVMSRACDTADQATARKFVNQAHAAVKKSTHWFKKSYLLFLLPYKRISEPDAVMGVCRGFRSQSRDSVAVVVLIDVPHGRSLHCGAPVHDRRLAELLQKAGLR